ncbi:MAG: hypothetical protein IPM18_05855 [Phycisphaerales bacterium]|nr:hypothetical protein [Phycisphaerales bacterium]
MPPRSYVVVPIVIAALHLLAGNLGPVSPLSGRAWALLALVVVWVLCGAACRSARPPGVPLPPPQHRAVAAAWLVALLGLTLLLIPQGQAVWLAGLTLHLYGVTGLIERRVPVLGCALRALGHMSAAYLLLALVLWHVPMAWNGWQTLSLSLSTRLGRRAGTFVQQGAATGGLLLSISFAGYLLFRAWPLLRYRWWLALVGLGGVIVLAAIQLGQGPWLAIRMMQVAGRTLASQPQQNLAAEVPTAVMALYSPLLLLIAGGLWVALLEPWWRLGSASPPVRVAASPPAPRSGRSFIGAPLGLACVVAGAVLMMIPHWLGGRPLPAEQRILFYQGAAENLRAFNEPSFEALGLMSAGMFGQLPHYLRSVGFVAEVTAEGEPLTPERLGQVAVLVIINPDERFENDAWRAIWEFVAAGGGLLVLGDHTDIGGSLDPLNHLLAPVDIRFRFDSAFTATQWAYACEYFPHPLVRGLDHANEKLQHSTGASLEIGPRVRPVVNARWSFSDLGNRARPEDAFLGDYRYQLREQLSDLVIVAEAGYGRGRVLVFGDTSAFQNIALPHSADMLVRAFRTLTDGAPPAMWYGQGGAVLLLIAFSTLASRGARGSLGLRPAVAVLVPLAGLAWAAPQLTQPAPAPLSGPRPIAYLDAAHANRFSLGAWTDRSVGGLLLNLARNQYLPRVLHRGDSLADALAQAELLVVIAPTRPYLPEELAQVRMFLERGGLLMLTVGFEEKAGAEGLLGLLELDIAGLPLGPVPIEEPGDPIAKLREAMQRPHFREAWPVVTRGAPLEVLHQVGAFDVLVFRAVGRGGALVVGDSYFLHDKILEAEKAYWPGNIQLLRDLFEQFRAQRGRD